MLSKYSMYLTKVKKKQLTYFDIVQFYNQHADFIASCFVKVYQVFANANIIRDYRRTSI